MADSDL